MTLALSAGCEAQHTTVRLTLVRDETCAPHGFACRGQTGNDTIFLSARNFAGTNNACAVVDFVELDAMPGCRSGELMAYCRSSSCNPSQRRTFFIERPDAGLVDAATGGSSESEPGAVINSIVASLEGQAVSLVAPARPVIVRSVVMFADRAECTSLDGHPDSMYNIDKVFGCVYSCPVQLQEFAGRLTLDLDTITAACSDAVRACAKRGLFANDGGVARGDSSMCQ